MMLFRQIFTLCLCFACTSIYAQGTDWVNFNEVSATHIISDPNDQVGIVDVEEKDIAVADIDQDGDPDLIVVRKVPFSTPGGRRNVLFINDNGFMTDMTDTLAPAFLDETDDRDVVIADLNNDTWLDVVTAPTFSDPPRIYMNLGNDGNGEWLGLEFEPIDMRIPGFTPGPKFCAVAAGDLTGNSRADLYFADYDNTLEDRLLINDNSGFYTDQTTTRMSVDQYESVFGTSALIADFNLDGTNDIVKVSASGNNPPAGSTPPQVRLIYNDGTGNFPNMDIIYDDAAYMAAISDFNRDGRPDLYIVDDAQDSMLINTETINGRAVFQTILLTQSPGTTGFGGNLGVGDIDNDGFDDIYVTDVDTDSPGCDRFPVALQHNGSEQSPELADPLNGNGRNWLPAGTFDAVIADFNMDGFNDLWLGTCDGNRLFFNDAGEDILSDGFEAVAARQFSPNDSRSR